MTDDQLCTYLFIVIKQHMMNDHRAFCTLSDEEFRLYRRVQCEKRAKQMLRIFATYKSL